jgi:hypothetical protein
MNAKRPQDSPALAFLAIGLIVGIYALVYLLEPFSTGLNQLLRDLLTLGASALISIYATLIFRLYLPDDAPRVIWKNFAIGFWLWTAAEFLWLLQDLSVGSAGGTASELTIAHLFWFVAYFFFSAALYRQYRIISAPRHAHGVWIVIAVWGAVIVATLLTMGVMGEARTFPTFIQYFFGFADLAVGIVAISMVMVFRGGALAQAWWGFVALAVSDILFELLDASMMASVSMSTRFVLELFSELIYLGAYLVLAFGFYNHYLLLRYGPRIDNPSPLSSDHKAS